jgi:hypothetical protein
VEQLQQLAGEAGHRLGATDTDEETKPRPLVLPSTAAIASLDLLHAIQAQE